MTQITFVTLTHRDYKANQDMPFNYVSTLSISPIYHNHSNEPHILTTST